MKTKGLIILLLIVSFLPAYYINRWMQRAIRPRQSFGRLMLYFLAGFALAFFYTYLMVWVIANLFPRPLK